MATGAVVAGAAAPEADAGLGAGAGTGEEDSICCKRRLGCSAFKGLNLRKRDEREEDTTATHKTSTQDYRQTHCPQFKRTFISLGHQGVGHLDVISHFGTR